MLHFGVISAYPREDWHSQRIADACADAGTVDLYAPTDFALRCGPRGGTVLARGRDVRGVDVWLTPRALGEHGDPEFQCRAYAAIGELGVPVVNSVAALLAAEDKVASSWILSRAGVPTPATVVVQSLDEARAALAELRVAVVKPPYGSLGIGVVRLSRWDRGAGPALRAFLAEHGLVYLQRFVSARGRRRRRDLRLFVVGDRVPAALEREAAPGDFRTNVHQGGRPRAFEPGRALAALAVRAARALGLEYAGIDLIDSDEGPTVLEVNGTPRWEGILRATGRDMAREIVARAAALAMGRAASGGDAGREPEGERERWQTRVRAS